MSSQEISRRNRRIIFNAARSGDIINLFVKLQSLPDEINRKNIVDTRGNNLLHAAVESNSVPCVKIVLELKAFNIFGKNIKGDTPLHHAIRKDCSKEIIELLLRNCSIFLKLKNFRGDWPIHLAILKNRQNIIYSIYKKDTELVNQICFPFNDEYLERIIEHTVYVKNLQLLVFFVTEMQIEEYFHTNSLSDAIELFISSLTDKMDQIEENYILESKLLSIFSRNIAWNNFEWLWRRVYFHQTNKYQLISIEIYELDIDIYLKRNLICMLHSVFNNNMSNVTQIQINAFYYALFILYSINHRLYKQIYKIVNAMWGQTDRTILSIHEVFDLMFENRIHEQQNFFTNFMGFLHNIEAQKSDLMSFFQDFSHFSYSKLSIAVFTYLPFMTVDCGDKFILDFLSNDFFPELKLALVKRLLNEERHVHMKDLLGQTFQLQPIKLSSICRIQIRRSVFGANPRATNDEKLKKLKSLPLPKCLLNFLLFNYTSYDLCKRN